MHPVNDFFAGMSDTYCQNDDCFSYTIKCGRLCTKCCWKSLDPFDRISESICIIDAIDCKESKDCWRTSITAFYYYYYAVANKGQHPDYQISVTPDFKMIQLEELFPNTQIVKTPNINIKKQVLNKNPGLVMLNGHHFVLFGMSKDEKHLLVQSFCNSESQFSLIRNDEHVKFETYFLHERFAMTSEFYAEIPCGGNDITPEEF
jgi:hypothetical protein